MIPALELGHPGLNYSQETMTWIVFLLAKNGDLAAAVELLEHDPDAHLVLASMMEVKEWGHGSGSNPEESYRIPEEYSFKHPCWEALWGYLPDDLTERVNLYFEELGP